MSRGLEGCAVEGWAARAHSSVLPEKAAQDKVFQKQNLVATGSGQVQSFCVTAIRFDIWLISRANKGLGQACVLILLL